MKIRIKSLVILAFSLVYALSLILFSDWSLGIRSVAALLLNLAAPLCLSLYLIIRDGWLKEWIVPIGFSLRALTVFALGWSSAALTVYDGINGTLVYILFALQAAGVLLMAAGSLYRFEYNSLLKWGSGIFIVSAVIGQTVGTVLNIVGGGVAIDIIAIVKFIILILFHIGIYFLGTEKA